MDEKEIQYLWKILDLLYRRRKSVVLYWSRFGLLTCDLRMRVERPCEEIKWSWSVIINDDWIHKAFSDFLWI